MSTFGVVENYRTVDSPRDFWQASVADCDKSIGYDGWVSRRPLLHMVISLLGVLADDRGLGITQI